MDRTLSPRRLLQGCVTLTICLRIAANFPESFPAPPSHTSPVAVGPKKDIQEIQDIRHHRKNLRLQNIKDDILTKLGLKQKPEIPEANHGAYTKSVQRVLNRLRETKARRDRRGSQQDSGYYNQISEIIALSEEAPGHNEKDTLQFRVHAESPEGELEVLRASLWVLLRYPRTKNGTRPRRVKLRVDQAGENPKMVASSVVRVRHTSWKQLLLPTSLITNTMQSANHSLIFRVTCAGCGKYGPTMILLRRRRRRRRLSRTTRRNRLHKRRPFMIIETKMKEDMLLNLSQLRGKRSIVAGATATRAARPGRQQEEPENTGVGGKNEWERISESGLGNEKHLESSLFIFEKIKNIGNAIAREISKLRGEMGWDYSGGDSVAVPEPLLQREVRDTTASRQCGRCCRLRREFVTFRQMDWDDWIISPRGFYANSCVGRCRQRAKSNSTCIPTRRSSLDLVYFDGTRIVNTSLRDMIIEQCGCL